MSKKTLTGYVINYGQSIDSVLLHEEGNGGVEIVKLDMVFKNKRALTDVLPGQMKNRIKKVKITIELEDVKDERF